MSDFKSLQIKVFPLDYVKGYQKWGLQPFLKSYWEILRFPQVFFPRGCSGISNILKRRINWKPPIIPTWFTPHFKSERSYFYCDVSFISLSTYLFLCHISCVSTLPDGKRNDVNLLCRINRIKKVIVFYHINHMCTRQAPHPPTRD